MKGFKNLLLLSFGLFWSQPKDFCCDLKCGHDMGLDVTTCSFLSLLYFSRDLSCTVSTFFFLLYCFHIQHYWLQLLDYCCDHKISRSP